MLRVPEENGKCAIVVESSTGKGYLNDNFYAIFLGWRAFSASLYCPNISRRGAYV